MRLAGTNDTDIRLDIRGQPVPDNNGAPELVTDMKCWMQDIWIEILTEESELLHEDEEGNAAYGYSMREFLNSEFDETLKAEIEARIRGKLSKREYIDGSSITIRFLEPERDVHQIGLTFAPAEEEGAENAVTIDITMDGEEVLVT